MPASQVPEQQAPMEAVGANAVVEQQPAVEPQPGMTTDMSLRGGAGCEICCGLCACDEEGCC